MVKKLKKVNNGEAKTQAVKAKQERVNYRHENGLYSDAKLTPEDKQSKLYKEYIEVTCIPKCKKFLRNQENLPQWGKIELAHVTKIVQDRDRKIYDKNKRAINERHKTYYNNNKQKRKDYMKGYRNTHKEYYSQYVQNYYKQVIANIKKIRDGKINELNDQQLLSVQSLMKRNHKAKFVHNTYSFYLGDKNNNDIYDRDNLQGFKDFLKSQVGFDAISQIDYTELENMPFGSNELSDEKIEKDEFLNYNIPENNQESGVIKPVPELKKTINQHRFTTIRPIENQREDTTTFRPMENQQENGYFSLNNANNILGDDVSQGF